MKTAQTKSSRLRSENDREMSPAIRQLLIDCDRQLAVTNVWVNEINQWRNEQLRERIEEALK